jgi:hypothetical protein
VTANQPERSTYLLVGAFGLVHSVSKSELTMSRERNSIPGRAAYSDCEFRANSQTQTNEPPNSANQCRDKLAPNLWFTTLTTAAPFRFCLFCARLLLMILEAASDFCCYLSGRSCWRWWSIMRCPALHRLLMTLTSGVSDFGSHSPDRNHVSAAATSLGQNRRKSEAPGASKTRCAEAGQVQVSPHFRLQSCPDVSDSSEMSER